MLNYYTHVRAYWHEGDELSDGLCIAYMVEAKAEIALMGEVKLKNKPNVKPLASKLKTAHANKRGVIMVKMIKTKLSRVALAVALTLSMGIAGCSQLHANML